MREAGRMIYIKNYEKEHAKEWQMNHRPGPSRAAASNDDDDDDDNDDENNDEDDDDNNDFGRYDQFDDDRKENVAGSSETEWTQVSHKKPPHRSAMSASASKLAHWPAKSAYHISQSRSRDSPTQALQQSPSRGSRPPSAVKIRHPPSSIPQSLSNSGQRQRPPVSDAKQPSVPDRSGTSSVTKPPPRFTFSTNTDNAAKAAYRAGKTHNGIFPLVKNWHRMEPDRTELYNMLAEMGVRLGSFVLPPQRVTDCQLLLWGDEIQIKNTAKELRKWVEHSEAMLRAIPKPDKLFAKVTDATEIANAKLDKKMQRDADRQRFQKAPQPGKIFECTGYFLWPVDEIRPEDLIGPSCEAFDPIRMLHRVHIVFDNYLSVFKIMSDNPVSVKDAIARIEGAWKEYVAKRSREITVYLVEPPRSDKMRKGVKTIEKHASENQQMNGYIPLLTGPKLNKTELAEWQKQSQGLAVIQNTQIRNILLKALSRLRFFRGRIQMKLLLGTFTLTTFRKWPEGVQSIPFDSFLQDMENHGTRGQMNKDFQTQNETALIDHVCSANHLFTPLDTFVNKLKDAAPVYTACFELQIPATGRIRLEIEMSTSGPDKIYERFQTQWTRVIDRIDSENPMELYMVRIHGGISWVLQVTTANTLDPSRISPMMKAFSRSIKFKPAPGGGSATLSHPHKVFSWTRGPPIINYTQKTAVRFRLTNTPYTFEFARYDSYGNLIDPGSPYPPVESSGPGSSTKPQTTHFGASLWSSTWLSLLTKNSGLEIGRAAEWNPALETFFPKSAAADPAERDDVANFSRSASRIVDMFDAFEER